MVMSPRALAAAARFGLAPSLTAGAAPLGTAWAQHTAAALTPGSLALITGPSGSGKSSALRALRDAWPGPVHQATLPRAGRTVIDRLPGPLDRALGTLAAAGLAEAALLLRPVACLSDGERARLALALAMHRAHADPTALVLVDEFAAPLDRLTAAGVAASLRRWTTRTSARVVVAAAAEDMPGLLAADLVIHCAPGRGVTRVEPGRLTTPPTLACGIEPGTIADYDALAPLHYCAGRPGAWQRVLRAVHAASGTLAGVLVVSPPTRLGAWRHRAWPGRYARVDARGLRRLNREVRRISRVIIDPRFRGMGLATALVRAYLNDPITPATEAVAAMAAASPFFASAGMTAYPLRPSPADQRLIDALDDAGLAPWALLSAAPLPPRIIDETRRWLRARGGSLPAALRAALCAGPADPTDPPAPSLRRLLAWRLSGGGVAFAHAERGGAYSQA